MYIKSNLDLFANNTFSNGETHDSLKYEMEHSFNYLKNVQESYVDTEHISKSNLDIQTDETGVQILFIDKSIIDVSIRAKYRLSDYYNQYVSFNELFNNTDMFLYAPLVFVNGLLIDSISIKTTLTEGFNIKFNNPIDLDVENNIEVLILENLAIDIITTTKDYLVANNYKLLLNSFETDYKENYPLLVYTQTNNMMDKLTALNPTISQDGDNIYLEINSSLGDQDIFPISGDFNILLFRSEYLHSVTKMKELKTRTIAPIENSVLVAIGSHTEDEGGGGEIIEKGPYLIFSTDTPFTLNIANNTKNWDGILEYSIDTTNWIEWLDGGSIASSSLGKLYMRGTGNTVITGSRDYRFNFTNATNLKCIGNIEYLLDYETVNRGEHPVMGTSCYHSMFYQSPIIQAPELPALIASDRCYQDMFTEARDLIQAPELPATILSRWCYAGMFGGCSYLIQVPELPATTLAYACYWGMFGGCFNIKQVPELPATTLADYCYWGMFNACPSIKISTLQSDETPLEWNIPSEGTVSIEATGWNDGMLNNTGGTFTSNPSINTTYYTSIYIPEPDEPVITSEVFTTPIPENNIIVYAEHKTTKEFKYLYGSKVTLHYPNIYEITNPLMSDEYTYKIFFMYKKTNIYLEYNNIMKYIHSYLCKKVGRNETDVEGMVSDFIYGNLNIDPNVKLFFDEIYQYVDYDYIYKVLDYEETDKLPLQYKIDKMYEFIEQNPIMLKRYGINTQNDYTTYNLYVKNVDLTERIRRDTTEETGKEYKYKYFDEDRYMFAFNSNSNDELQLRFFIDGLLCEEIYVMIDNFTNYLYIPTKYIKSDSYIEIEAFNSYEYSKLLTFIDESTSFNIVLPEQNIKPTLFDLYFTDNLYNKLPNNNFKVFVLLDNEVRNFLLSAETLEYMGDLTWEELGSGNSWNAVTNEIIYDELTKEYYINIDSIFDLNDTDPDGENLKYVFLSKLKIFCVEPTLYNTDVFITINKQAMLSQVTYSTFSIPIIKLYGSSELWRKYSSHIRLFLNGRFSDLNYDIIEDTPLSSYLRINNMITVGDTIAVDISPYSYRLEFELDTLPNDFLISFNGKLSKPFDFEYYDVYLNGRKLTRDNLEMITPDKIKIFNVVSTNKFRIYRRDRDYEYYGFTTTITTLLDKLLESSFITTEEKNNLIDEIILDINPDANLKDGTNTEPEITVPPIISPEDLNLYEFYYNEIIPEGVVKPNSFYINKNDLETKYPVVYDRYPDKADRIIISSNINGDTKNAILIGKGPQ